ncbi:MAG: cytochrome b [Methylobacillus sp.]|jgi:cytochrome b561|nr:cytochrome b [Methylobacillus sp.]
MNDVQRYTKIAIILHWLIALLIIALLVLGLWLGTLPEQSPFEASFDLFNLGLYTVTLPEPTYVNGFYFNLHKSLGVTVLALIALRVLWRLTHAAPPLPNSMQAWEKLLAHLGHIGLYILMIAVPVSGFIMSWFGKYGVAWFGVPLVDALKNEKVSHFFEEVHEFTAWALIVLLVIHVLAAIKHKLIDKDTVMKRMSLLG